MRVSSEALAKEDWSFGGLRRTPGATDSCPWGSTGARDRVLRERESAEDLDVDRTPYCDYNDHIRGIRRMQL